MKWLVLAIVLALGGCSLIVDVPDFSVEPVDGGEDGGVDYRISIEMDQ